jgi:dihydrofolate synthase/folylpolyglutamate synthase
MTYPDALGYLDSFLNYEIRTDYVYDHDLNLARMDWIMELLGRPERKIPFVLVGGTKGKGSTASFLASILREAGYRAGLYTSPHLEEPLERIVVGGSEIRREDFARLVARLRETISCGVPADLGNLTFFEFLTAAAILYFAEAKADLAVLEVGLGGRLDATNIVRPVLSILTPVSYDHQDKLGTSLSKIAGEKLPIVKENSLFVCSRQRPGVERLARSWAFEKRARSFFFGRDFDVRIQSLAEDATVFDLRLGRSWLGGLRTGLAGAFQAENAAAAVQAATALDRAGHCRVSEQALRRGLENICFRGRFQVLKHDPLVMVDGAHNGDSMRALRESVLRIYPARPVTLILGMARDKDIRRVLMEAARLNPERLIVTEIANPRTLSASELTRHARSRFEHVKETHSLKEALNHVLPKAAERDLILVAGSLYLAGEALALLNKPAGGPALRQEEAVTSHG